MALRDLYSNLSPAETLAPASRTATANGTGVDLRGFDSAMVVLHAGTAGGTSPSFTFELQESDDNSTFSAVADADLDGTEPAVTTSNDDQIHLLGYKGVKRYLRLVISAVSGTSPTLLCSAVVLRGHPHLRPVN